MNNAIITLMGFSTLIYILPFFVLILMRFRKKKEWFNALIGVCAYFNFYYLAFVFIICTLIGSRIPGFSSFTETPVGRFILMAIGGGVFCELGRFLGLKFGIGEEKKADHAIAFSIGFGLANTFAYVKDSFYAMAMASYVSGISADGYEAYIEKATTEGSLTLEAAKELYDGVASLTVIGSIMYPLEVLEGILAALALTILMLGFFRKEMFFPQKPQLCIVLCVAAHFFTEGMPIILRYGLNVNDLGMLIYICILIVALAAFIVWSFPKIQDEFCLTSDWKNGKKSGKNMKESQKKGSISSKATVNAKSIGEPEEE